MSDYTRSSKHTGKKSKYPYVLLIVLITLLFSGLLYRQNYYKTHFEKDKILLNVDVGKLTTDEAYSKIQKYIDKENINLHTNKDTYNIKLNSVLTISKDSINNYFKSNDISDILNIEETKDKVTNEINKLELNKNSIPNEDAKVVLDGSELKIQKEKQGTVVDIDKLASAIPNNLLNNQGLSFKLSKFYTQPIVEDTKELTDELSKLKRQQQVKVSLDINGSKEEIPQDIIKNSITPEGVSDRELVTYLNNLDLKYRTKNSNMNFKTHNNKNVTLLSNISYGWQLDIMKTYEKIKSGILSGDKEVFIESDIVGNGLSDKIQFGGNYAEVDLNEQKAYIFKDGKEVFKWDVITGLPNKNNMTNVGIHEVLYKESPSVLRGYNNDGTKYASPVNYWIPFNWEGEGFHDANWQVYGFGGDKYKTLGSHGCVNTSPEDMKKVWELTYQGMPVIVWGDIYNQYQ